MKTKAQQYCEAMEKANQHPTAGYERSVETDIAWKGEYKKVKFMKHGGRRGLRFDDGSKLFFGEEGNLLLPVE